MLFWKIGSINRLETIKKGTQQTASPQDIKRNELFQSTFFQQCIRIRICSAECAVKLHRLFAVTFFKDIFAECSSNIFVVNIAGFFECLESICVKNCPMGAIRLEDNHPVIDESLCVSCGMCASKCPRGVIKDVYGILGPQA